MENFNYIDKLAYIHIEDKRILMALTNGKTTYYIPGGKRELGESDEEALIREVKEELGVELKPETIRHYGIFRAQAHGKPPGTFVRMTCYQAEFDGKLKPSSEIADIDWYDFSDRGRVGPADQLIFDSLHTDNLIS